jgi:hypothetical protein
MSSIAAPVFPSLGAQPGMDDPTPRRRRRRTSASTLATSEGDDYGVEDDDSLSSPSVLARCFVLATKYSTTLVVSIASLGALLLQPPGWRFPACPSVAVGLVSVLGVASLVIIPVLSFCLSLLLPRPASRELRDSVAALYTCSVDGLAALALVLILVLPLLSGSPTPVSVLAEPVLTRGFSFVALNGSAQLPTAWAGFSAGDVLLSTARLPLTTGGWVVYRDAGSMRNMRERATSTHVARLMKLASCEGKGRAAAEACQLSAGGPATHALLLRRARTAAPGGAVVVPSCLGDGFLDAPPESWECALVPRAALLGSVQLRLPRLASAAVPLFSARRRLLAARPPQPLLSAAVARWAERSGLTAWLQAPLLAAEAAAEAAAKVAACSRARAEADAASDAVLAAGWWHRSTARAAASQAVARAATVCAEVRL